MPPVGSSLEDDLRSLGFDVRAAADAAGTAAALAAVPAAERVALVDARFVGHLHALRLALTDPRFPAAAVEGALTAQPEARGALTRALATVTDAEPGANLPDALAPRLEADGVGVHRPDLGVLVATVPADADVRAKAEGDVAAVDDEAVRLRTAVKSRDGFFTTYCVSPYSRYLARWCARRGFTPNQVTTASLLTALIAAGCAATGTRPGFVAAGVLLIFSFVLDCTDGQLARYSLQYSTLGAWLDATFDRAKEYAYYAGLAIGAAHGGGNDDVWALALGAMVLQTCRHVVDFSFNEANHDATANTSPTAALSDKLDSVGWTVWARRMIVLPIGERWALIAVLTAFTTPRTVFYVLLAGCALAACYTTAGRVLRSLTRKAHRTDRAARALADLADSGPVAELASRTVGTTFPPGAYTAPLWALLATASLFVGPLFAGTAGTWQAVLQAGVYAVFAGCAVARPLKGPLDWLVPPLFRASEYGIILLLAAKSGIDGALPAAFGLVAAVAYHHYDTVYRIRGGSGAPPHWLVRAIGGHEGRVLAVTIAAALWHNQGFTIALTVLAAALALAVLSESIRFWVSSGAPAVHDETGEPA
ncbi:phosphatidylglycerophosphate synthase [Streptomyces syringium]|uniref:Phosphatidylglycerophosphate synthase n=1 Tax=Streptomyces syringium TaxID=76729 RepID=A0ABS4YBK1_9ACTN|nr:phosphatidylglycerophosphate synthase [Streptomyces syringium]